MRYFYLAVSVAGDKNESVFSPAPRSYVPGYYAYVVRCGESDNIKAVLDRIGGLRTANIYPSKRVAGEVVNLWNEGFKREGVYLYDTPMF